MEVVGSSGFAMEAGGEVVGHLVLILLIPPDILKAIPYLSFD